MVTRMQASSWLASSNVKAFLRVVRAGESWNDRDDNERDERAFRVRYGGWDAVTRKHRPPQFFDSFADHPRVYEPTPTGDVSSAAGAFQITATTWDDLRRQFPWLGPSFKPFEQLLAAALLIYRRGALDDVIDGRLEEAVAKCGREWASLPGSTLEDGGSKATWERVRAVWKEWGGGVPHIAEISPTDAPVSAPIEQATDPDGDGLPGLPGFNPPREGVMPAPIMIMLPAIMQSITQMIPALATLFGKNAEKVGEKVSAATAIVDIVTKATGAVNAQDAVEKMAADPAKAEAAKAAVLADPGVNMMLTEVGGGIAAAHQRAIDPAQPPLHRNPAFWISLLLLPMAYYVVVSVIGIPWGGKFLSADVSQEVRSMVIGGIMGSVLGGIVAFWLGTSYGSARKTDIIAHPPATR